MAYEVIWLPKVEKRFDEIVSYLKANWTDKEIADIEHANTVIDRSVLMKQLHQCIYT